MKFAPICSFLYMITLIFCQKNPNFAENRSTIVHLFEWKWKDIAQECEKFLSKHGYGGVQISPPNENVIIKGRPWYERYQPVSYKLKTRSGDEEDFKNMTKRCNKVGVRIYVDAVVNHMSSIDGIGTAGNRAQPSKNNFPGVPFRSEHFHNPCSINNYNNADEVRGCELLGLKDLDQGQEYVREKIVEFLNHLIDLGVAGFRIDAAKHIHPNDLKVIFSRLKNLNTEYDFSSGSRPFIYQEIPGLGGLWTARGPQAISEWSARCHQKKIYISYDNRFFVLAASCMTRASVRKMRGEAVNRDDYTSFGCVLEFKYGHHLSRVFRKNDKPRYLDSWGPRWGLLNSGYDAVTFIDNHDTQRYESDKLTYKHSKQYKMAVAFMLAHPYGTGRIMSSYTFTDRETSPPHDNNDNLLSPGFRSDDTCTNGFICEHRWRQIYNMVEFRNVVTGTGIDSWQTLHDHQIAFCRGRRGFIVFNNEGNIDREVEVCLPEGEYCDIISGDLVNGRCTGKTVKVKNNGKAHISLHGNEEDGILAIHLESRLKI